MVCVHCCYICCHVQTYAIGPSLSTTTLHAGYTTSVYVVCRGVVTTPLHSHGCIGLREGGTGD